jgi:hypothetical protein
MAEQDRGQPGFAGARYLGKLDNVSNKRVPSTGSEVAKRLTVFGRSNVTAMIIRIDMKAGIGHHFCDVRIAQRVFSHSVGNLKDSYRSPHSRPSVAGHFEPVANS